MRDYIAYAREHVQPKLTDEAQQRLIQAYVDMRKIGSGRGQISAYPRQLESLIRLAEAHAKVRLSQKVEVVDVEEAWRLHREALKQSATDPLSGKIDVGILTTGLSATARKKRADLIAFIKDILKKKNKTKTIPYQKVFTEVKENSQIVSFRESTLPSHFLQRILFLVNHTRAVRGCHEGAARRRRRYRHGKHRSHLLTQTFVLVSLSFSTIKFFQFLTFSPKNKRFSISASPR